MITPKRSPLYATNRLGSSGECDAHLTPAGLSSLWLLQKDLSFRRFSGCASVHSCMSRKILCGGQLF
jgi:hypothetical protein